MKDFTEYRPATIDEAVDILYGCLEEEDIKTIKENSPDEFAAAQHFDLGMAIRNAWIFSEDSQLHINFDTGNFITMPPDILSEEILTRTFSRVKSLIGADNEFDSNDIYHSKI